MRKTTLGELRDKEVVNCCTGTRLGFITDLEIDEECGRIISIIVDGACRKWGFGFLSKDSYIVICWENIQKIGCDIIVVNQEDCCERPNFPKKEKRFF